MSASVLLTPSKFPRGYRASVKLVVSLLSFGLQDRSDFKRLTRMTRRELDDLGITRADIYRARYDGLSSRQA